MFVIMYNGMALIPAYDESFGGYDDAQEWAEQQGLDWSQCQLIPIVYPN